MKTRVNRYILFLLLLTVISCSEDEISPRPFGYFRIDLPESEYKTLDIDCPYQFDYSTQARIIMKDQEKCWINIYYSKNSATVYLTYVKLDNNLKEQLDQTQQLTYEHQIKATQIDRIPIAIDSSDVYGLKYRLYGDVASYLQFYITDSSTHFIRGALYFDAYVNADSLKPVVEYMDSDIQHLIESFRWK